MISEKRMEKLKELVPDNLSTAAQHATASAYPNGLGGIDESERCLTYRIGVRDFDDFRACLRIIGAYNYFVGEDVADAFATYFPTGDVTPNHNNGINVQVGREGSPVVYLRHSYSAIGDDPPLTEDVFVARCKGLAKDASADEGYVVENDWGGYRGKTFRLWWD